MAKAKAVPAWEKYGALFLPVWSTVLLASTPGADLAAHLIPLIKYTGAWAALFIVSLKLLTPRKLKGWDDRSYWASSMVSTVHSLFVGYNALRFGLANPNARIHDDFGTPHPYWEFVMQACCLFLSLFPLALRTVLPVCAHACVAAYQSAHKPPPPINPRTQTTLCLLLVRHVRDPQLGPSPSPSPWQTTYAYFWYDTFVTLSSEQPGKAGAMLHHGLSFLNWCAFLRWQPFT